MQYRRANVSELPKINEFIYQSKNYWGYSPTFMMDFMNKWGVTLSFFETCEIILAEENNTLLGLFAFKINEDNKPELDLFFINAKKIQQGLGKLVWQQAIEYAKNKGWHEFLLISDPNAEGFYRAMGAEVIDTYESFPGRFVPIMQIKISKQSLIPESFSLKIP
ncbi:GNAT family N-acetyltransferase [Legionella spiritensis]|uniref:N-acetyltransferase domain-containing protein n=1 Tax=Legionella spiritensis TaxID=452 RepID=A0A0W0Z5G5_LEGSP|nr:GNAT family N-acetyltransferase [Legionella spiritensis]KTD64035.1 hypothetical protein Lspi_1554 [Legionella spiritensis]SNV37324.1 Uncharacterised protein [Legionella spiritensis]VEG90069.1 Uncharacterised protein [Legionella spiritensis]